MIGFIGRVLEITPSIGRQATSYAVKALERDPQPASNRTKQDRLGRAAIKKACDGSRGRYGARKVWHPLRHSGHDIARCTAERLMKVMGLQGVVREKKVITTNPDAAQPCSDDKVNHAFVADMPTPLWVSGLPYVSSWRGVVSGAFIIDGFARKIVGWRASPSMTTGFMLDALNQAICQRAPSDADKLIHHSNRGRRYLSIRYTGRPAKAGIDTSRGSVGECYDNALAESIIGRFKAEVVKFPGPWKTVGQVAWETLKGLTAMKA